MKFKLFLTDSDAMEYINSNYPGAIVKYCSADYAGYEEYYTTGRFSDGTSLYKKVG